MTFNERFEQFLGVKRISQRDFAELTGFPTYSLSKIITGTTKTPKIDLIMVLMEYFPELNLRWLLLEEGEIFNDGNSNNDNNLLLRNEELQIENSRLKDELLDSKNKVIELLEKRTK